MSATLHEILKGAAAGAAGTTALNATAYLDMVVRARPASSTPEKTVKALADETDTTIPGDDQERKNRLQGLGPLTGIATGVGVGVVFGLARALGFKPGMLVTTVAAAAAAMAGSMGPMTALGVTDPRKWTTKSWLSDLIPHLVYGATAAAVLTSSDRK